ncbi:MAG: ABC transporter permease [Myxococcaceae bacterium]|nr:ABC transporter permease [Myxococcaceae bacterium]
MDTLLQDLRFAARALLRRPAFALVMVLTLALGIGANTALFSVVNGVLLKPLPLPEPERLVVVWTTSPDLAGEPTSLPDFRDWRAEAREAVRLASVGWARFDLTGAGEPVRLEGAEVTADVFDVFGVQPMLGRGFEEGEDRTGAADVVVLSHQTWRQAFGGDPSAIGRTVTLSGRPTTVVGVMPEGFRMPLSPFSDGRVDAWVPMSVDADAHRRSDYLYVFGRLLPGVTQERAQAVLRTVAERLQSSYPDTNARITAQVVPLHEQVVGASRQALLLFLGAVGLLLLIACANVANLLLAHILTRGRELAVRTALGAGRGRLVRQVLTESLLVSVMGGALGLVLGAFALDVLRASDVALVPRREELALDGVAVAVTALLTLATGLLAGLAPALRLRDGHLQDALKQGAGALSGGNSVRRLRGALVLGEVALALVLLVGAGLLTRSLLQLQRVDLGFRPERVLTARLLLPEARYPGGPERAEFVRRLLERVEAAPGVEAAGVMSAAPLGDGADVNTFSIEGRPPPDANAVQDAQIFAASAGALGTLGVPLLAGRFYTTTDEASGGAVVVINRAMAERFWPGQEPLGARLVFGDTPLEVVGVVGNTQHVSPDAAPYPQAYVPVAQRAKRNMVLVVRGGDAGVAGLTSTLRREVQALDPLLPLSHVRTMEARVESALSTRRLSLVLAGAFAAAALLLAAVGLFGVVSHMVSQRTREVGIRLALGAQTADVLRLVVGQGMRPALGGIALGLLGAGAAGQLMAGVLFGVSAVDPLTFVAVPAFLGSVAFVATWLPARRATRVQPTEALRAE